MAKSPKPKKNPPKQLTAADQATLDALFPANAGIADLIADPAKAMELAQQTLPPGMAAQAFRLGAAIGQAASVNGPVPIEAQNLLRVLASESIAPEAFKALRMKLRITQGEIGERTGVGQSLVASWENGHVPLPAKAVAALVEIAAERMTAPPLLTGDNIRKLRKSLGLSLAAFAAAVGTTVPSVVSWEKLGDRPLTRNASDKVRDRYQEELKTAA